MRAAALILYALFHVAEATREHLIYWNSTSKLFSDARKDGVEASVRIHHGDTFRFACPDDSKEYLIVYRVDAMSAMNCLLTASAKQVLRCDAPHVLPRRTARFRTMNPLPVNETYEAGASYYFISTSSGTQHGMYQESKGLCYYAGLMLRLDIAEITSTQRTTSAMSSTTVPQNFDDFAQDYEKHPRHHIRRPKPTADLVPYDVPRTQDERRAVKDAVSFNKPPTITEDKIAQVVEWASRGLEGTFRFKETAAIDNRLDDSSSDPFYVVSEDAAPYSSSSCAASSYLIIMLLILFR